MVRRTAGSTTGSATADPYEGCHPRVTHAPDREPSGIELCRLYRVPNTGPRPPAVAPMSAREHVVVPYKDCTHASTAQHLGNSCAFYLQCTCCRYHLEYYPRQASSRHTVHGNMKTVEEVYSKLPSVVKARAKQEKRNMARAKAKSAGAAYCRAPSPPPSRSGASTATSATPPPAAWTRAQMEHQDGLNLDAPGAASSSNSGDAGQLLRPKARARPSKVRQEVVDVPESPAGSDVPLPRGTARNRKPTPAIRRVNWHDMAVADASRDSLDDVGDSLDDVGNSPVGGAAGARAPRDALAAMRTLASLPEATVETTRLLNQLEAHLVATTAAAELQERQDLPMTTDLPSPIRPLTPASPQRARSTGQSPSLASESESEGKDEQHTRDV